MALTPEELVNLTRVVPSTTGLLRPGQPLTVDVIPGYVAPPVVGPPASLLPLEVRFAVYRQDGTPASKVEVLELPHQTPLTQSGLSGPVKDLGNPELLHRQFLFVPKLDFLGGAIAARYRVVVAIMVTIPGTDEVVGREVSIPITIPPLRLPSIAVFSTGPAFEGITATHANALLIMTNDPGIGGLDAVLTLYRDLLDLFDTLSTVANVAADVVLPFAILDAILRRAPQPPNFYAGSAPNWTEAPIGTNRISGDGFDEENVALLLIGAPSQKLHLSIHEGGSASVGENAAQDIQPIPLDDVLTAPAGTQAAFVRGQLEAVVQHLGLSVPALPTVPAASQLIPLDSVGVVCIADWNHEAHFEPLKGTPEGNARKPLFMAAHPDEDVELYVNVEHSSWR